MINDYRVALPVATGIILPATVVVVLEPRPPALPNDTSAP